MQPKKSGKERILAIGRSLMIAKGYGATSIDEICAGAGVQKGTFFYHFKNKEALGKALVEYHQEQGAQMMADAPFLTEPDPLKRIDAYIDFIIEAIDDPIQQGCLLGVLANEVADSKKDIKSACTAGFNNWAEQLGWMIEEARKRHIPERQLDINELAEFFIVNFEGALILARGTGDKKYIKTSLNHYKIYLHTLLSG